MKQLIAVLLALALLLTGCANLSVSSESESAQSGQSSPVESASQEDTSDSSSSVSPSVSEESLDRLFLDPPAGVVYLTEISEAYSQAVLTSLPVEQRFAYDPADGGYSLLLRTEDALLDYRFDCDGAVLASDSVPLDTRPSHSLTELPALEWDREQGALVQYAPDGTQYWPEIPEGLNPDFTLSVSPDGRWAVYLSENALCVYDARAKAVTGVLTGETLGIPQLEVVQFQDRWAVVNGTVFVSPETGDFFTPDLQSAFENLGSGLCRPMGDLWLWMPAGEEGQQVWLAERNGDTIAPVKALDTTAQSAHLSKDGSRILFLEQDTGVGLITLVLYNTEDFALQGKVSLRPQDPTCVGLFSVRNLNQDGQALCLLFERVGVGSPVHLLTVSF